MKQDIYGYLFDFWVFSVLQKYDENELPEIDGLHYEAVPYKGVDSFAFPLCEEEGVFYNVTTSLDECGGTLFIRKNPQKPCDYFNVPWQNSSERDVCSVDIDPDYIEPLEKINKHIIKLSPVRKLYILIRCQCRGDSNLIGMLTVDQYVSLMRNNNLLGNVAYAVYDKESCSIY